MDPKYSNFVHFDHIDHFWEVALSPQSADKLPPLAVFRIPGNNCSAPLYGLLIAGNKKNLR
jgi:hypothetical protein